MSNSKEAEERKKEILDIAEALFIAKGYEKTSTTDILERVGIARGTLYYHFKSKEEILDALIDRIIDGVVRNIKSAVSGNMSAKRKLLLFIGAMRVDSEIGEEITEYAHRPQNALMHQKIQSSLLSRIHPLAVEILQEGIEEGCCFTDYPKEVAEMLLIYSSVVFDDMNELSETEREIKVKGFVFNMERLLGMETGSLLEIAEYIQNLES